MQQKTPCRNILDTNFDLFNLRSSISLSSPAEWNATLLPRRTQVLLHPSNTSGWERKVFPHFHVHLHGKQMANYPYEMCPWRLGTVLCLLVSPVCLRPSPTPAQTYFSPWRLGTGTSPASWRTIIKGTWCKMFWYLCIFLTAAAAAALKVFCCLMMFACFSSRYFLSTEDNPKRRHLYR